MEVSRIGDYEAAIMVLSHITQLDLPIGNQVFRDALSEAIRGGNESLVQLILGFDHDPYAVVQDYHTVAATDYMLEAPTNPTSLYPTKEGASLLLFNSHEDKYLVMFAASLGRKAIVQTLLASGRHVDPLTAIKTNNIWLTSLLLDEYSGGIDLDTCNMHALEYSIQHRNLDMARLLISYGADPHISCWYIRKVQSECRPIFELLLKGDDEERNKR